MTEWIAMLKESGEEVRLNPAKTSLKDPWSEGPSYSSKLNQVRCSITLFRKTA